ncbi:hypothetical protein [Bartonella sp. CB178]
MWDNFKREKIVKTEKVSDDTVWAAILFCDVFDFMVIGNFIVNESAMIEF